MHVLVIIMSWFSVEKNECKKYILPLIGARLCDQDDYFILVEVVTEVRAISAVTQLSQLTYSGKLIVL